MKLAYQTIDAAATALAGPDAVTAGLGEIVADVREGLLALAVGTWATATCRSRCHHRVGDS